MSAWDVVVSAFSVFLHKHVVATIFFTLASNLIVKELIYVWTDNLIHTPRSYEKLDLTLYLTLGTIYGYILVPLIDAHWSGMFLIPLASFIVYRILEGISSNVSWFPNPFQSRLYKRVFGHS